MDINEYAKQAISTLTAHHSYGDVDAELTAQVFGLGGEAGEVLEKFKKIIRDKQGKLDAVSKQEIEKELGDVLWYVNSISYLLGSSLEEVARKNIEKLKSRSDRHQLHGSGDNR